MKWITLFFLFFALSLHASSISKRTIEKIDYRTQSGSTIVLIKLSDGSTWKWMPDKFSENFLRSWSSGDQVIIGVSNQPGFTLQNISNIRYIPTVVLTFNSYTIYPQISQLNETKKLVELSDGSKWRLLYDFNLRELSRWALGDRVIPVSGIKDNFELINIDIPHQNNSQMNRHLQFILIDSGKDEIFFSNNPIGLWKKST